MNRYSLSLLRYLGVLAAVSAVGMGLPACGSETSAETDREALEILYHATDGPNWLRNLNWMTDAPLGEWSGVTTNDDGRVTGLDLAANELDGGIPPELGNLDRLRVLDLTGSRTEVKLEIKGQGSGLGGLIDQAVGQAADQLADPANRTVRRNHLSGCIPSSLQDQLDLESSNLVGLSFCGEGIDGVAPERPTGRPATQSGDSQGGSPEAGVSGNSFPADTQPSRSSGSSSSFPDQDREALAALFEATNGPGWLNNENWLSDQPVDNWYGVRVDGNAPMFGVGVTRYYRASAVNSASAGAPSNVAINEAQAGEFTLSMLRPVVGTALTATLGGPDGDVTGMMWPWAKPKDMASGWNDIDGATPAAYTQVEEDEGYYLETVVSHTDGRGFGKSAAAVTARVVTADGDSLIARYDANGNGMIERSEVITAINDYLFGEGDGVISRSDVIRLINLYLFGPSTPPNPPEAPTGLMAAENGQTRIDLSWSAPSSDGGSAITGYRIEVSEDRTDWSDLVVNTGSTATSYSHTGLTAGSTRHYRVSAINSAGTGPPSNLAAARTSTTGTDRAALVALYNATNGPNWTNENNWLTDEPLSAWHGVSTDASGRVTALRLYENGLSGSIPSEMGNLTSLEALILWGNSITDVSGLSEVVSLRVLSLGYSNIPDISPVAGLTNLTDLGFSDMNIPDLSVLSGLSNLEKLRLIATNTTDLSPLSGLTNLTSLTLSHNSIADLSPLAELTNLTYLNFWENQIEDISALSGLTNLTGVGLGLNNVTDISALSGLTKLETLWLNNNNVTDISSLAGLTNLTELYLGTNSITDISALAELTSLMELDLASNNITDLAPLAGLTNLRNLDVRGNVLNDSSIAEHVPALESNGTVVLFDMRLSKGDFDIELVFLDDFTESQKRVLQYTALRWMAVIIEDVPEYEFTGVWSGQCGGQSFEIPSGERIDDLRIYVATGGQSPGIHGTGGIYVMREESHLPVVGCMTFDLSHANLLVTGLHEIGHVLGFASEMWNEFGFYQNPPNGDDHFSGPLAIAAFDAAGGSDYEGAKVPLRQGESHWRLSVLEGELMSPSGGGTLSAITVQSLADLGYGVDVAQADAYTLPRARGGG